MSEPSAQAIDPARIEAVTRRYITAEGERDLATVANVLDDALRFRLGDRDVGKSEYLKILERLGLVWRGNRIKRIFIDGNEACVLYDFQSDTEAGAVACVEWLRFGDDRIVEIDFLFEREHWDVVDKEMRRRAEAAGLSAR